MVGKRVQFDEQTWAVINLMRRSFQQLADEALADLLAKHGRPADLKIQLHQSLGKEPRKRQSRAQKPES